MSLNDVVILLLNIIWNNNVVIIWFIFNDLSYELFSLRKDIYFSLQPVPEGGAQQKNSPQEKANNQNKPMKQ